MKPTPKLKKYWAQFRGKYPGSRYILAFSAQEAADEFARHQTCEWRANQMVEARCGSEVATAVVREALK